MFDVGLLRVKKGHSVQLTSLRNLTESFAKNVHAIARGRFATGGVVDELPSNICYIIHIGKILTMLYKENPEEHKFCIRSDSAFPAAAASESAFTKLSFLTTGGSRICGKGGAQRLPRAPQARRFLEGPV